ncbi:MAG: PP2C family protein-serine/threonine phosphatase [Chloracidobacterium sp.]
MTAPHLIPSAPPPAPVGKNLKLIGTGWAMLLSLVVIVFCSGRVYSPPMARLTEHQARARAEQLLQQLQSVALSGQPVSAYQVAWQCLPDPIDQSRWEFGFLAPDERHYYRLTLAGTGAFRAFALYQRAKPATTSEAPSDATLRSLAETWRDFLMKEAQVTPVPAAEAPPVVRQSPLPGHVRDVIRRWKTNDAAWPFVEVAFEGQALQSLALAQAESPTPPSLDRTGRGLLVLLLGSALWLPWFIVFFRGVIRREMGSLTMLSVSGVLAALLLVWLVSLFAFAFLSPFAWRGASLSESEFVALPDLTFRIFLFIILLLVSGTITLIVTGAGFVSLSVTESYDWKRRRQLLEDVYRLSRRGEVPPGRVARWYLGGLALALWVLAVESGVEWQSGQPVLPWHEFSAWTRSLAVGNYPGWKLWGECLFDIWLVIIWLLPMLAFARNRLQDRSAALAIVGLFGLIGFPLISQSWMVVVGYGLLLGGLLWTLVHYGWMSVGFASLFIGGLFPVLWVLRFPSGFELTFLAGSGVVALPLVLVMWSRRRLRPARNEAFALAPNYVRERLRLERWREERDVRWLIHCNLLPPSGFRDERQRVVAEYAHLPEHGREWFMVLPLGDDRVGIAIGEVSGQELQASLLMATMLAAIKSKAARYPTCPVRVVERLNDFLSPRLGSIDSQVRMLYGIANFRTGEFTYCNAGYVAPVALRVMPDGTRQSESLALTANPPLDGRTDLRFAGQTVHLERGSYLVLMSDWVGELSGLPTDATALAQRNANLLANFGDLSCQDLPAAVIRHGRERLLKLPGASPPETDSKVEITVVCVEF